MDPVFDAVILEANDLRQRQPLKQYYVYSVTDSVAGQTQKAIPLNIEQGTDFDCFAMSVSSFSYDAGVATSFPIPNALGVTSWAGRGLSIYIVDTGAGVEITNGFVPIELLGTPGYGMNMTGQPFPLKYFFNRNAKIRFDVRNRDASGRTHEINIALFGYKYLTPAK